ncbi:MAG TPA: hypothetical protein VKV77_14690 [Methylovirgula sp.]|nr:hypothetical protein [Methylovirgula sp.]
MSSLIFAAVVVQFSSALIVGTVIRARLKAVEKAGARQRRSGTAGARDRSA